MARTTVAEIRTRLLRHCLDSKQVITCFSAGDLSIIISESAVNHWDHLSERNFALPGDQTSAEIMLSFWKKPDGIKGKDKYYKNV
jgi:hypothetical protein